MALWGNKDLVGNAGSVAINLNDGVIIGSATTFSTAGYTVSAGDVIVVGTGATMGYAVISSVTSNTVASVATTQYLISSAGAATTIAAGSEYYITQMPVSVPENPAFAAPEAKSNKTDVIYGVDTTEQSVVNDASGDARKYAAPHAGWVGITTYNNHDGTLRVKTEVLVAGSTITSDREDTTYPDA